jgi:hypothetical protein
MNSGSTLSYDPATPLKCGAMPLIKHWLCSMRGKVGQWKPRSREELHRKCRKATNNRFEMYQILLRSNQMTIKSETCRQRTARQSMRNTNTPALNSELPKIFAYQPLWRKSGRNWHVHNRAKKRTHELKEFFNLSDGESNLFDC